MTNKATQKIFRAVGWGLLAALGTALACVTALGTGWVIATVTINYPWQALGVICAIFGIAAGIVAYGEELP